MIDYALSCKIHDLSKNSLKSQQIATEMALGLKPVKRWLQTETFTQRKASERASLLDPHKATIVRLLQHHEYTSVQLMQKIQEAGYKGGYTILKDYVRRVRPPSKPAFLMLSFDPGECGQVDWGSAGVVQVGNTRRRLRFFVMVLAYSRMMYVEFVLSHPRGEKLVLHSKYIDFAKHYGFEISACKVRAPNEKGRVENGVGYVKKHFLNGIGRDSFDTLNPAAADTVRLLFAQPCDTKKPHPPTSQTVQKTKYRLEKQLALKPPPFKFRKKKLENVNSHYTYATSFAGNGGRGSVRTESTSSSNVVQFRRLKGSERFQPLER